jgi:hypothetical protein
MKQLLPPVLEKVTLCYMQIDFLLLAHVIA